MDSIDMLMQMQVHLQHNIAHELRTPMAAIRGYSRMLLDQRAAPLSEVQKEYLKIIQENTGRLISLVNWMSRLVESETGSLRLEQVDLRALWGRCRQEHTGSIEEKSIQIEERFLADAVVTGDRQLLADVLRLLLSTSLRYTADHGKVSVELSRGRDHEAVVRIADTGPGIPADDLRQLLERDSTAGTFPGRLREAHKPAFAGAYDIIGLHGGRLFVNSRLEGSTFLFTLPAVSRRSEERLVDEHTFHSGRRRR
jgi:signal transduction histidine kinase